jgi:vancomycin permeability regulator SanA
MSVLILLGGPLTIDNKPGTWLKSRLDKTIKVYNEYNFDYIILTGGDPTKKNITEAEVMYNYLKDYIPENKMYKEIEAKSTFENAIYSKNMITNTLIKNIYVLTSDFHIDRSKYIFENIFNYYKIKPENVTKTLFNIFMISAETPINKTEMQKLINKEKVFISYLEELKLCGKI